MISNIKPTFFQNQIYDRLFKAIFGRDNSESKQWRLDLYNALRGTDYTDPDALEINTIENVIYLTMRNDISFLIDSQMTLYEQQSSYNPNMPLRGLMYFAQLYQIHLSKLGKTLHRSTLIEIPNPKFVVFYNGDQETADVELLRLSDAFITKDNSGDYEWTAELININSNHNKTLQKKCKALYDYVKYVSRIKENKKKGLSGIEAVNEAVDWAISENLLNGFFKRQKEEILAMSLTEFNAEEVIRDFREEGREEGALNAKIEVAKNLIQMKLLTIEQIAQAEGLPVEKVRELAEEE
ncbi:MAG: hypothetical protein IJ688_14460 [Treponema sp.]|nr:hypothetical protein [Treponema sp.]